jgi:hypothetical protein
MVEKPNYDVVKKLNDVEIRRYENLIVAKVEGSEDNFDILFRYISGGNKQKAKVSMTAPVISTSEKIGMTASVLEDANSLAFILPSSFTLGTTPEPLDGRIRIIEIPSRHLGVIRFSGRWSNSIFEGKTRQLLKELTNAGIGTIGQPFSMLYNPPFMPWFLRRNEVAVEVKP